MEYKCKELDELTDIAKAILEAHSGKVFAFYGEMGAGKTTLIKRLCEALEVSDIVNSPTFSIVNEYRSASGPVYHFDFYRIKSVQEAWDMGHEEYFYSGNYCFIEWPQKIDELLPEDSIAVHIEDQDGTRIIKC